ncbi:MAG: CotH kinase family protein [Carnobacterium sp.]|uniref:CotH kinase family protein n=1 Tax=Carnobacterium sp. TaxID=48221 RepID=UPI003C72AB43
MKHTKFVKKKGKMRTLLFLVFMITGFLLILNLYLSPPDEKNEVVEANDSDVTEMTVDKKNNLPIMVIDTNGQTIDSNLEKKEVEINGIERDVFQSSEKYQVSMKLYEPNLSGHTIINKNAKPTVESNMVINVRGQSSLRYKKKQYTIRLVDEYDLKNPQELLGMAIHDKWVLNGMYSDKSLIRNYLSYKMGRDTMEYAPDTRFVELYMKTTDKEINIQDDYMGVYLLTEKIERDENRIAIDKNNDKYKDISFIVSRDKVKYEDTVLKSDWNKLEDDFIIDENNNIKARTVFTTTYPSKSNMTELYEKGIIDYINKFEYSLRASNFDDKREGFRKYIDVDSFIDYAIMNEITKNIDGGEVSTYFYKDIGGLLTAGPIWDFDQSLGNTPLEEVNEPTGFRMVNVIWYERLFQDEDFVKRYKSKYRQYRNTIWSDKNIDNLIDEALLELGPSADRNRRKWYLQDSKQDYEKEVEDIRVFLKERFSWMDENMNLLNRIKENAIE